MFGLEGFVKDLGFRVSGLGLLLGFNVLRAEGLGDLEGLQGLEVLGFRNLGLRVCLLLRVRRCKGSWLLGFYAQSFQGLEFSGFWGEGAGRATEQPQA